jgi:hypothetical protein
VRLPTASKLALVDECPPSWVLPGIRETHEAAEEGRDLHESLKAFVEGNTDALSQSDDWRDAVLEVVGERLRDAKCEAAYAYDTATGTARLLGYDLGRNYGQSETEIAGAADFVVDRGDVLEVYDLKTGLTPSETLEHHAQMKALACAAGLAHMKPVQTFLIIAPRDGQRPYVKTGPRYEILDLLALGEWLRTLAARVRQAHGQPDKQKRFSVGKWCGTCRARLYCPTQVALIERMAKDPDNVATDLSQALALPDTRRLAYHRLRAAEKALQWVRGQLYASMADLGPIDLGNGKVFGPHATTTEEFDPEVVWPWVSERFGVDVAREAMNLKTSKTRIGQALKKVLPNGKKQAGVDKALDELRAIPGAVEVKTTTEVGEYDFRARPKELADAAPVRPPAGAASVLSGESMGDHHLATALADGSDYPEES